MKSRVAHCLESKKDLIDAQSGLGKIFGFYEDFNFEYYRKISQKPPLFGAKSGDALRESYGQMVCSQKNGFIAIYHWLQGELFDLKSVEGAVA
jgi:hypothetical protein